MGKELREIIKNITTLHLKKYKSYVFGQNLTGVGWVAGTLPKLYEKDGIIELPTSDVAAGGFITGAALMKKKPIYIIRYQGFNWFNCIFIINYACKSKAIWKIPAPMLIRGMSLEGLIGPVAGSSQISIFYKMPGIKIVSPMSPIEYEKAYQSFEKNDDVCIIPAHKVKKVDVTGAGDTVIAAFALATSKTEKIVDAAKFANAAAAVIVQKFGTQTASIKEIESLLSK